MAPRDRPHLLIRSAATAEAYRRPTGGGGDEIAAPSNRQAHAQQLSQQLQQAQTTAEQQRAGQDFGVAGAVDGVYIQFESFPGVRLALESLDSRSNKPHPELVSVREVTTPAGVVEYATVFVPDGTLGYFVTRLRQYAATASQAKPANRNLIERIQAISLASVETLWTDPPEQFPEPDATVWWEVWLRRRDGHEASRFQTFARHAGIRLGTRTLGFADRVVILAEATTEQLAGALDVLDDLAELRRPHELAQMITLEPAAEQADWVDQLAERTQPADADAPAVCVVDTGVHRAHPLLAASLAPSDCHACEPTWGADDREGHGTEMAGLALYGDVGHALLAPGPIRLRHRLESVKLKPPPPLSNPPELYGAVTATATSLVEIEAPHRARAFSLAVTAKDIAAGQATAGTIVVGQPTSWSAAIDALAAGRSIQTTDDGLVFLDEAEDSARRLFLVSAGNVHPTDFQDDHLLRNDIEPVEDPAQAWNALTVGAYTQMDSLATASPHWAGWTPVAARGELSPHSRTSVAYASTWPVKPDVVLEGGNVARSPAGTSYDTPEELQLATTKAPIKDTRLLTVTCATSAATAQAAHLAASILADYPSIWPETVRALIVHSAEWTDAMRRHVHEAGTKAMLRAVHRRYGMGVPDLGRATRSATDALTLIAQDTIHPFHNGTMREMHLHDLPWPTNILAGLGHATVRLRVTLSYFIEPNPGRRGWIRRYSYASHGLRFDVRRATESTDDLRKRLNRLALAEEEHRPTSADDTGNWVLGPTLRTAGSIHTDIWEGTAADLANRGAIAVYPITGWWKDNKTRDRSHLGVRYALVVSIDTPEQDVDIWTPVAQQIGVTVPIEISPS
ncbi:MAG TPA: S8 family peptidase [Micromonosporaceae bacterium]|nr:S8 family peptidase [Micromonosporaceae bacterium]